jgi:lipoprotein-anchoring transpeptidase ErfK/SrfK
MRIEDAKFLYKYVDVGMTVTVTGTTPGKYVVGT